MKPEDTKLGGPERGFPATSWSLVWRLSGEAARDYREGLEKLCARYWKPVYLYVRIAWAKSNEDAKDLTQAFFLWLCEGDALRRYAPERGGFRRYLKLLLGSFVGHRERELTRLKRGGGTKIIAIETDPGMADPKAASPEEAFDRAWLAEVLRNASARVRERLESQGRGAQFQVFQEMDLQGEADRPSYEELAGRLGMTATQVRNYLFVVREAVREEIRAELAETTQNDQELQEEWNLLFGGKES